MPTTLNHLPQPSQLIAFGPISEGLRRIIETAHRGRVDQLWAEIERYLAQAFNSERAVVLLRTGGTWRPWDFATTDSECRSSVEDLPEDATTRKNVVRFKENVYAPIIPGAVGAVLYRCGLDDALLGALELVSTSLQSAATTCEKQMVAAQNLDDVQALQRVATRILKSHDLSEIMQLITLEAKRLLSADICGIMLREGDEVVMKRCVGNFSIATASLRMRQGQGIAGQVFATMQPCRVEDYLESDEISRDFFSLAQDERVRSALAAPLLSRDEVIGVLEVWRRRPSTFTDLETTRLVALANLVSIAIENARLYAAKQTTLHELERANQALNERYDVVRNLVVLTQDLIQHLLGEQGLASIAARAADHLGASVFITDRELRVVASSDGQELTPDVLTALKAAQEKSHDSDERAFSFGNKTGTTNCLGQGIFIAKELVGFVVVVAECPIDDAISLAVGQVVLATALYSLEQRSASRARSETLDSIVWDLLEGSDNVRHAAVDRLREMKIGLPPVLRVLLLVFETSGKPFGPLSPGLAALEERRRVVREACMQSENSAFRKSVVGARGANVAVLVGDESVSNIERAATKVVRRIAEQLPSAIVLLGVSAPSPDVWGLPKAHREAKISIDVARQRGRSGVVVYDRSGVVGLLFSVRQDAGIQGLVDSTFGRLMKEDPKHRQQLVETLRVYFDLNCSQEAAAQRLGIHRKTVSYRLAKISELTGLDFSTHEDRLLADLALYVHATISEDDDLGDPAS